MTETHDKYKLTAREQATLETCVKIEEKCAVLYRHFEKVFEDIPEIATLWHTTAGEEEMHAEAFRQAAQLKGVGLEGLCENRANIELLKKIDSIIESSKQAAPLFAEAIGIAISLEMDLREFHCQSLKFNDAALEKVFSDMVGYSQLHAANWGKDCSE